jgi:hypothetical protein
LSGKWLRIAVPPVVPSGLGLQYGAIPLKAPFPVPPVDSTPPPQDVRQVHDDWTVKDWQHALGDAQDTIVALMNELEALRAAHAPQPQEK